MLCYIPSPPQKLSHPDALKTHFQVLKSPGESKPKGRLHIQSEVSASPWFMFSGLE